MQKLPIFATLPLPFSCLDPGSFAGNTLRVRLPEIARRVIAENSFPPEVNRKIEQLIAELPDGWVPAIDDPGAPDAALWVEFLRPYRERRWRELSFLVCEHTFYRRILQATGYFQAGPTYRVDPFAYQKHLGFVTSREAVQRLVRRLNTWRAPDFAPLAALCEAIESNLWGNRADLSLWPADAQGTLASTQLHQAEEFLVANEVLETAQTLLALPEGRRRVDFLIDNAGYELVCDLASADLLLGRGWAGEIHFHLKAQPTFVSDAFSGDVLRTVELLQADADEQVSAFGARLAGMLAEGRLVLESEFFWTSPLAMWEMPAELRGELAQAGLVISKGDAHYRRLLGDLGWPETTPFAQILAYFPTRLAALRIAKCDLIAGLRAGQAAHLDRREPDWRSNGRWGFVQLK